MEMLKHWLSRDQLKKLRKAIETGIRAGASHQQLAIALLPAAEQFNVLEEKHVDAQQFVKVRDRKLRIRPKEVLKKLAITNDNFWVYSRLYHFFAYIGKYPIESGLLHETFFNKI